MNSLVEKHPLKEKRKANKPLLERKRRARINDCLTELKHLVLTSLNKDISRFSKMEKADVLDMTVQYLKACKARKANEDNAVSFQAGFNECASEIIHYIMKLDDVDPMTKAKLLSYLATSCKLSENIQSTTYAESQPRLCTPVTCSIGSQSPCRSPSQIIPSPTASSPLETHSPSAFSPLIPSVPRSPNEHTVFMLQPVTQYMKSPPQAKLIVPKLPLPPCTKNATVVQPSIKSQDNLSSQPAEIVKRDVWRPW